MATHSSVLAWETHEVARVWCNWAAKPPPGIIVHLPKPRECRIPRVSHSVNHGLGVPLMSQHPWQVNNVTISTVLMWCGMLTVAKAVHVWGHRACGKPLYLSLNFAVNLKLLYKVLKKNRGFFFNFTKFYFHPPRVFPQPCFLRLYMCLMNWTEWYTLSLHLYFKDTSSKVDQQIDM